MSTVVHLTFIASDLVFYFFSYCWADLAPQSAFDLLPCRKRRNTNDYIIIIIGRFGRQAIVDPFRSLWLYAIGNYWNFYYYFLFVILFWWEAAKGHV